MNVGPTWLKPEALILSASRLSPLVFCSNGLLLLPTHPQILLTIITSSKNYAQAGCLEMIRQAVFHPGLHPLARHSRSRTTKMSHPVDLQIVGHLASWGDQAPLVARVHLK